MQNASKQILLPFAHQYNTKPGANGEPKTKRPLKFRFHRNGEISVRVDGRWHHDQVLSQSVYLSAPAAVRQRIIKAEFQDGKPRVLGSAVLVGRRPN
jgi:hypothetical protein